VSGTPNPDPRPSPVLIPACKPSGAIRALVYKLVNRGVEAIIVVNDGSGPEFDDCFEAIAGIGGVFVVHHAVNLGKGAALKTGMYSPGQDGN
jgi:glycosyltransferase involved in cell wall biosynthesis